MSASSISIPNSKFGRRQYVGVPNAGYI